MFDVPLSLLQVFGCIAFLASSEYVLDGIAKIKAKLIVIDDIYCFVLVAFVVFGVINFLLFRFLL